MPSNPFESVQYIKSVGPKRAESFAEIGIKTVHDLLFYFPSRYLDRSTITNSVKALQYLMNGYDGDITVIGKVEGSELIRTSGRKQIFKVRFSDNAGWFDCLWFQGIKFFKTRFKEGEFYAISAKPSVTKFNNLQFVHPDFDRLETNESHDFLHTGKIIPFYKIPKELRKQNIGDFSLRRIISNAASKYADSVPETLPSGIIARQGLLPITGALRNIHSPESHESLNNARNRFKFEELFYFESLVAMRRHRIKETLKGFSFEVKPEPIKRFLSSLNFQLTEAQLRVLSEIRKDMESSKPMNRLLQGDVGSGKTVVALISMMIAVENGYQAVIMAPTEILANQHYNSLNKFLDGFDYKTAIIIGGQKKSERKSELERIKSGEVDIIIGTHALFEENVEFTKLGLVVIDEQHRFGVVQRSKLIEKGSRPDVLVMTATPIPRTLSMTVYGDLDVSLIDQMPRDRKPIITKVTSDKRLPEVYDFVEKKAREGYQTYIVYPLVEESEKLELKAAEDYYDRLRNSFLKRLSVGLIHGKMTWKEKEDIMKSFAGGKFDVLISTTVIEVGIDVPNANIIVINDAFRFGLSQLHQLRGRVGRGTDQAYCVLITKNEYRIAAEQITFDFGYMSNAEIEKNKSIIRLNAMSKYSSGFELSEIDLKLRGPGDIFGTKQSGLPDLQFADISSDVEILIEAKREAFELIEKDPEFKIEENSIVKKKLLRDYSENLKYAAIG